ITTAFADGRATPYEYLVGRLVERCNPLSGIETRPLACVTPGEKWNCYRRLIGEMKNMGPAEREARLCAIFQVNGIDRTALETPAMLGWNDVAELARHSLVEVGAHTVSHPYLPSIRYSEAWREIRQGRRALEDSLDIQVRCFAYPYGGHNRVIRAMARAAGFKFAFTTSSFGSGAMAFPRVDGVQWMRAHGSN
ncbi:MAG: polysaccharide deacetylase family protein, partial [Betaproteobacteria bacterium]